MSTAPIAQGPVDVNVRPVSFVFVETKHSGFVGWWWADEKLHDNEYQCKVGDAISAAVAVAVNRHGVTENKGLCCQWEGVEVEGAELDKVQAAANDIARVLARFRSVVPLA